MSVCWSTLPFWGEAHLVITYNLINMFLNFICKCFVKNCCIYIHQTIGLSFISYYCLSLPSFCLKITGFTEQIQQCPFTFYCMGQVKNCTLVESTWSCVFLPEDIFTNSFHLLFVMGLFTFLIFQGLVLVDDMLVEFFIIFLEYKFLTKRKREKM